MTDDEDAAAAEATKHVADALPYALGGDFVTDWVLIADVVLPDGSVGTWHLASESIRYPHHIGLLEWAAIQVRAAIANSTRTRA